MSDIPSNLFQKGDRVFVRQLGKPDVIGKITWIGPNRYGPGMRFGVKDDEGGMHWVDEDNVEREPSTAAPAPGEIQKGSRVRIVTGADEGVVGDVFLCPPSGRVAVRDDDEETYWVERERLELE